MRLLFLGDPLATLFTVVYGEIVLYVKTLAECRLTCMRSAPASWRCRISHLPISSLRRHRLRPSQARIRAKRGNHWPSEGMRSRRPNVSLSTEKDIKIPSPLRLRSLDFVQEKCQNLQNEHPWACFHPTVNIALYAQGRIGETLGAFKAWYGTPVSVQPRRCFLRRDDLNSLSEVKR